MYRSITYCASQFMIRGYSMHTFLCPNNCIIQVLSELLFLPQMVHYC